MLSRAGSFIGCRNVVDLTEDAKPAHGQNGSYTGWMYNKKAVAVVETNDQTSTAIEP